MRLDLGSGNKPAHGFLGVDRVKGLTDYAVDLVDGRPWPFENDSVEELFSSHFIEHIPAVDVPVWVQIVMAPDLELRNLSRESYQISSGYLWRKSDRTRDALVHFFEEAYRVAKPGALFTLVWPSIMNRAAYRDPTHRRFIDIGLVSYLSQEGRQRLGVEPYDIRCNWVGTATDILSREAADGQDLEELRRRAKKHWGVAEESMMRVIASKPGCEISVEEAERWMT